MLSTRDILNSGYKKIKRKEWKKIYHAKTNQKWASIAILLSDKNCNRDKKGHFIIRGAISGNYKSQAYMHLITEPQNPWSKH